MTLLTTQTGPAFPVSIARAGFGVGAVQGVQGAPDKVEVSMPALAACALNFLYHVCGCKKFAGLSPYHQYLDLSSEEAAQQSSLSAFAYSSSSSLPSPQQQALNNGGVEEPHTVISMNTSGSDPMTMNTGMYVSWEKGHRQRR